MRFTKPKWHTYTVKVEVNEGWPMYIHAASEEDAIDACKRLYGRIILDNLGYRVTEEEDAEDDD